MRACTCTQAAIAFLRGQALSGVEFLALERLKQIQQQKRPWASSEELVEDDEFEEIEKASSEGLPSLPPNCRWASECVEFPEDLEAAVQVRV